MTTHPTFLAKDGKLYHRSRYATADEQFDTYLLPQTAFGLLDVLRSNPWAGSAEIAHQLESAMAEVGMIEEATKQ